MLYKLHIMQKFFIKINDDVFQRVKDTTFFGIYINECFSWKDHISSIGCKLSKSIAILYCVSSVINKENLRSLHSILILPYLAYCVMVWGHTYGTH